VGDDPDPDPVGAGAGESGRPPDVAVVIVAGRLTTNPELTLLAPFGRADTDAEAGGATLVFGEEGTEAEAEAEAGDEDAFGGEYTLGRSTLKLRVGWLAVRSGVAGAGLW
jgi:hypothetical protein